MSLFGDIVFFKVEGLMPYTSRVSRFFQRGNLKHRSKQRNTFEPSFGQILIAGAGFPRVRKWPSIAVQIEIGRAHV